MTPEDFIARLERVRKTGPDSWLASCPAHDDQHPSLTVRRKDDGGILVKCHSECGIDDIVGALGLELSDLFPEWSSEYGPRLKNPFPAADVLRALADETLILAVFIHDLDFAVPLKQDDIDRARLAAERILAARSLALGR